MFANTQPDHLITTMISDSSARSVKERCCQRLEKLFETWDAQKRATTEDLALVMRASAAIAQHLSVPQSGGNTNPGERAIANTATSYLMWHHIIETPDCGQTLLSLQANQSVHDKDYLRLVGCLVNFAAAADHAKDCEDPALSALKSNFGKFSQEAARLADGNPSMLTSRMGVLITHLASYVGSLDNMEKDIVLPPMPAHVKEYLRDISDLTWELRKEGWNEAIGSRFQGMISNARNEDIKTLFELAFLTPRLQNSVRDLLSPDNAMLPDSVLADTLEDIIRNSGVLPGLEDASREWVIMGLMARFKDRMSGG